MPRIVFSLLHGIAHPYLFLLLVDNTDVSVRRSATEATKKRAGNAGGR